MPHTFSFQETLPKLPVPDLKETCAIYLQSLVPLLSPAQFEETEKIVREFESSALAHSLQQRLLDIEKSSTYNWLEETFWIKKAYLEWRNCLMVNSNWYTLGKDDITHPKVLLETPLNAVKSGEFTHYQIRRAAHLIVGGVEYKNIIQSGTLPIEMLRGNQAQCMHQYRRIFGVTRIPMPHCDSVLQHDPSKYSHITVLVRDQVFRLDTCDGQVLKTVDAIEKELLDIVGYVQHLKTPEAPISLLTSWHRDSWAVARNHLLALDPSNRESTDIIEQSLFTVSLDDHTQGNDLSLQAKTIMCGHQGIGNGHNRWYDKCINLVIENNGKCAISGEHSPLDALTASYVLDHMLKEPCPGPLNPQVVKGALSNVHHLKWKIDATLEKALVEAQTVADVVAADSDVGVLIFNDYGSSWVKKNARIPPDAFYQMAIQLAYYRSHRRFTATYESSSTRKYSHGRTETIRSCTTDSIRFVEAMENKNAENSIKYNLLVKAANTHRDNSIRASDGHGCDRHLLALSLLNADHEMLSEDGQMKKVLVHPIFKDPSFSQSQQWLLSTSSLHAGVRLMGSGFGAVYPDGYGINYMPDSHVVKFGIESKCNAKSLSTANFMKNLTCALRDMRDMCDQNSKEMVKANL
ncbi:acyltransferase ChoActase/COT/CPT [Spinellus fusiger]|nr:acyltransferase ChoActase/COT/CPT [Spinellus fusiger]